MRTAYKTEKLSNHQIASLNEILESMPELSSMNEEQLNATIYNLYRESDNLQDMSNRLSEKAFLIDVYKRLSSCQSK